MKIQVVLHPQAKVSSIESISDTLHVYVTSPAREGKANLEAIKLLANHFHIRPNQIFLISGHLSKHKTFQIIL